jgi:hypothetical protein
MRSRTLAGLAIALACLGLSGSVGAQPEQAYAKAEALFRQGSQAVNAGHFAEACPELEQAQALVMGIGVTLYLGECYEQTHRLAGAWRQFQQAEKLAAARGDSRAVVARERAQRLWPRLAKLVLVAAGTGSAGQEIADDGARVDAVDLGVERPVDPGTHHVRATAPGRAPWEASVEVAPGATVRLAVPELVEPPPPQTSSPLPVRVAVEPEAPPHAPPRATEAAGHDGPPAIALDLQRATGIVLVGVGVAGFALGSIFGLQARSKLDDSNTSGHCQPDDRCDGTGLAERSDALTSATISTVSFVGGAACLAGGAALYLLAPKATGPDVSLLPRPEGGTSLVIRGRW